MPAKEQCFVRFYSPGTFVSEESERPIAKWDSAEAVRLSRDVRERYDAKPFGFQFVRRLLHAPISDGRGGMFEVEPKQIERSGMHFLGGVLLTLGELEHDNDPKTETLRSNMRCNDWPIVVENCNSWRATQPFGEDDKIVGNNGETLRSGNEPELVEYRRATIQRVKVARGY